MGELLLLPLPLLLQSVDLLPVDPDGEGVGPIQHVLQLQTRGEPDLSHSVSTEVPLLNRRGSNLVPHHPGATAAGSGIEFNTGILQAWLTLLPQSHHGVVADLLLLCELGLHFLSLEHCILRSKHSRHQQANCQEGGWVNFRKQY